MASTWVYRVRVATFADRLEPTEYGPRRIYHSPDRGDPRKPGAATDLCAADAGACEVVEACEETEAAHLAMSRHIIESIGLFSVNAPHYRDASAGETVPLSKRYLRLQMLGLAGCIGLDVMAQRIHEVGVGIVVNDVPSIPFEVRWRARQNDPSPEY